MLETKTKRLLYMIGYPGAGKTTLCKRLLSGIDYGCYGTVNAPFAHTVYRNCAVQLGVDRDPFGGTDTLPLNVQPVAIAWLLATSDVRAVLGEGDRLANEKFFKAVKDAGWQLDVVHLTCDRDEAARRRAARSKQNESWVKGRITKVDRLARAWATITVDQQNAYTTLIEHPVIVAIRTGVLV